MFSGPNATFMPIFVPEAAYKELTESGLTAFTTASASAMAAFFHRIDPRWVGNPFERGFQELIPLAKAAAQPGSLSSFTGAGAQPMHTDAAYLGSPPRYLAFECVDPGESSCRTDVWVSDHTRLLAERPSILTATRWVFHGGGHSPFYSPVLDTVQGLPRIRFDKCCMSAAYENDTSLDEVSSLLASYTQRVSFEWVLRGILIVDNWRCMHARGHGGELAPSRRLRRWYLGAQNGLGI